MCYKDIRLFRLLRLGAVELSSAEAISSLSLGHYYRIVELFITWEPLFRRSSSRGEQNGPYTRLLSDVLPEYLISSGSCRGSSGYTSCLSNLLLLEVFKGVMSNLAERLSK